MAEQLPLPQRTVIDGIQDDSGAIEVRNDLAYLKTGIVNIAFIGFPKSDWVMVDAGIPGYDSEIIDAAEARFGSFATPRCIVLTHGHFDHIGSLEPLLERWEGVPVYAHPLEIPFLNGGKSYPPPAARAGGGIMTLLSPLFPRKPIDISGNLLELPADGHVPDLKDWKWIHTPGHTPGHISLWRECDKTLLAGDAFITTRQESAYHAIVQTPELHGPPRYFTQDWNAAHDSVRKLAGLEPDLALTGHGKVVGGAELQIDLHLLADNFVSIAVPE
ncbi:MBL fold metallo-hydrolase [Candidatus Phyllobacterium onerii]|uniref:MBL fold metallo-hydrolase n=1 Tax=Candidatus Phyllobacterium onerii TaxID=3020828 RepID=UPI00232FA232|nr:MBL fold metallo-hydrolase [Phyllobacterium sp. IY22]